MGLLGKLLALPVRIVNVPARAVETLLDTREHERVISKPLDALAEELEKVDE